jgi:hypothetical protein
MFTRLAVASTAAVAGVALVAGPASATTAIGTTTAARASSAHVKTGSTFTISGAVRHGRTGLAGQTVYLYERTSSKAKWTRASNATKPHVSTGTKGHYTFTATGLKHGEQYKVVHPAQTINGKRYGRSVSKVVTVAKA